MESPLILLFYLFIFLIIYTYLLYPIVIWLYSLIVQNIVDEHADVFETRKPIISLVISAYNEEQVIAQKLKNCLSLNYPPEKLEIIIASDGSTDETNDIINNFDSDRIQFFNLPRMGKVNVLNKIVPKTNGEILVFSDANTIYNNDALIELVKYFKNEHIGCVCGNLKLINPKTGDIDGESIYWRYEKWIKKSESKLGVVVGANGAIYAIRKKLIRPLPPTTINDDFHISMEIFKKGYNVIFSEKAIGFEYVAKDFYSEFKRHIKDGAGHYREILYFKSLLNPFKGKYFLSYFSHRFIRWIVPFLMISIFLINYLLISYDYFFFIFYTQIVIYLATVLLFIMKSLNINIGILNVLLFFMSTNIALLIGFIKNIIGIQSVKWDSTERIK